MGLAWLDEIRRDCRSLTRPSHARAGDTQGDGCSAVGEGRRGARPESRGSLKLGNKPATSRDLSAEAEHRCAVLQSCAADDAAILAKDDGAGRHDPDARARRRGDEEVPGLAAGSKLAAQTQDGPRRVGADGLREDRADRRSVVRRAVIDCLNPRDTHRQRADRKARRS